MQRTDWSHIHEISKFHLLTLPLALMSCLYGTGVRARNSLIKNKGKKLPGFVLSIGNITVGGTGKTPATIMFAKWVRSQGSLNGPQGRRCPFPKGFFASASTISISRFK